jgi:ubiquinone/menaquinone biosynthesis C-methylase UbiE
MNKRLKSKHTSNTSWQKVSGWYNNLVGNKGHYFHEHVVIPGVLKLLKLEKGNTLLDIACGQGVLAHQIEKDTVYHGVDAAASLIQYAKTNDRNLLHSYSVADVTKVLSFPLSSFTHATIILALQNIETPEKVLENVQKHLRLGGKLVIVLNHPSFRIPRQTSWEIDEQNKIQYRRINAYLSPLKIPITMHPGKKPSSLTWSFHRPLSFYTDSLAKSGFVIENIAEWTSDKVSVGKAAKMENYARNEIPLFMAILARKDKELGL